MSLRHIAVDEIVIAATRRAPQNIEELAQSIRAIGLLHPVTITEELHLVAGGNRLAACKLLGWQRIPAIVLALSALDAELAEIDENLLRNELSVLERAEHFARRKRLYEAKYPAAVRPKGGRSPKNGETVSPFSQDTADKTGFSRRTIQHEIQIAYGLRDDTKALIRTTTLADQKRQLLDLARVEGQQQVAVATLLVGGEAQTVAQGKRVLARQAKAAALQARPRHSGHERAFRVIHGDCIAAMARLPAGRTRLIVADPPYNIGIDYGDGSQADRLQGSDYLTWCRTWMAACARLLTPDGSLWVLISDEWADHFGLLLREVGLHRRSWIKWYETFGVNCTNNFNRCSRHLFYMVKDPARAVFNAEAVTRPSDRLSRYHDRRAAPGGKLWDNVWMIPRLVENAAERVPGFPTQLPIALLEPIVLCASDPGDQVLDPFLGSGTSGVAAVKAGREFIGIEKRADFAQVAEHRLRLATTDFT